MSTLLGAPSRRVGSSISNVSRRKPTLIRANELRTLVNEARKRAKQLRRKAEQVHIDARHLSEVDDRTVLYVMSRGDAGRALGSPSRVTVARCVTSAEEDRIDLEERGYPP